MKSMISRMGVPGRNTPLTPIACSLGISTSGMIPPINHQHIVEPPGREQFHQPRGDVVVSAGEIDSR